MKSKCIFLGLSLLLLSTPIYAQYYHDLYSIHFVDELNGWFAGGRLSPAPRGIVISTTDGGESWNNAFYTEDILNSVFFTDQNNGCAVGNNGTIIRTTDGGQNWIELPKLTDADFKSVSFINQNVGWTAGNNQDSIYLLKTTDGGENWIVQQVSQFYFDVNDIQFVNENIGWMAGVPIIIKTTDGGVQWSISLLDSSWTYLGVEDLHFLDPNIGWAVGSKIVKTIDGGLNWVEQLDNESMALHSVHFINTNLGWAAGRLFLSKSNLHGHYIIQTTDGGENWVENTFFETGNCWSIYFINETTDSGDNWFYTIVDIDNETVSELPNNFLVSQNYPNPFNPTTTIIYQLPEISFVTIKVYDVLGKEIATLVNEEKPVGNYEVEFNGNELTSGIYFYQLRAGSFMETKKMILLK
jgi:photosystem II stability/assembly factor-like uncharacterized protein